MLTYCPVSGASVIGGKKCTVHFIPEIQKFADLTGVIV